MTDLVIVGAGPAGAAAACHFARAGFAVVLIDQHHFPRDKVCGDFVGPWALEEVDRLGLSSVAPFSDGNRIRHAALHLNGSRVVGASIPHVSGLRDYGLCIPRVDMDNALVNAAVTSGARFIPGARVIGYQTDANGVTVLYTGSEGRECLRTRLLIGADGSTSQIARILRGKKALRRDCIIAVRAYFDNVVGAADLAGLYADSSVFPGYYWVFPTGVKSANVGIGMLLETWPSNNQRLSQELSHLTRCDPALRLRLSDSKIRGKACGWPLTTFNPHLPLVADRVALIGDAAGLINPLNGEGIQYALQSARWSAETLREPLARDELTAQGLAAYPARVYAEMRLDMAVSRLFVDFTRNRALNRLMLTVLDVVGRRAALDREYADVFGGVLAGIVRSRALLTKAFVLATLEQAVDMNRFALSDGVRPSVSTRQYSMKLGATLDWALPCVQGVVEVTTQLAKARRSTG